MWPFVTQKDYVTKPEEPPVTLSSDDTMEERARKIWYLIGFVNDRHGAIPLIAYYLTLYKDLDVATDTEDVDFVERVVRKEPWTV